MSVPIEIVRDRLALADCRPRGGGERFIALCPAHEDGDPSLSIREGADGRALVHCFSGCTAAEITAALGLALSDLFEPRSRSSLPPPRPRRRPPVPGVDALLQRLREREFPYRCTHNPALWVSPCPRCGTAGFLVHAEPGRCAAVVPGRLRGRRHPAGVGGDAVTDGFVSDDEILGSLTTPSRRLSASAPARWSST